MFFVEEGCRCSYVEYPKLLDAKAQHETTIVSFHHFLCGSTTFSQIDWIGVIFIRPFLSGMDGG